MEIEIDLMQLKAIVCEILILIDKLERIKGNINKNDLDILNSKIIALYDLSSNFKDEVNQIIEPIIKLSKEYTHITEKNIISKVPRFYLDTEEEETKLKDEEVKSYNFEVNTTKIEIPTTETYHFEHKEPQIKEQNINIPAEINETEKEEKVQPLVEVQSTLNTETTRIEDLLSETDESEDKEITESQISERFTNFKAKQEETREDKVQPTLNTETTLIEDLLSVHDESEDKEIIESQISERFTISKTKQQEKSEVPEGISLVHFLQQEEENEDLNAESISAPSIEKPSTTIKSPADIEHLLYDDTAATNYIPPDPQKLVSFEKQLSNVKNEMNRPDADTISIIEQEKRIREVLSKKEKENEPESQEISNTNTEPELEFPTIPAEIPSEIPAIETIKANQTAINIETKPETTMLDILSNHYKNKQTLSELQKEQFSDFKSSISLNLKLAFIKELFGGKEKEYKKMIDFLTKCENFSEARMYIKGEKENHPDWEKKQILVDNLMELITRKFS